MVNNNKFLNNFAEIRGGAFAYSPTAVDYDNSTSFVGNEALLHSSNVSAYPYSIKMIVVNQDISKEE